MPKATRAKKPMGGKVVPYSFCKRCIPDASYVTLTYSDDIDAAASANQYLYQWRLNSLYDCNYTSTGVQPVSFDQWMAMYTKFTVFEASVEVRVVNRTAGSVAYAAFVVDSSTDSSVPSYSGFTVAAQERHVVSSQTQYGAPPAVLKIKRKVSDVFGVPVVAVDTNEDYSGGTSAGPNRTLWGSLAIYTAGATDALSIYAVIKMKARFWRPVVFATSLSAAKPKASIPSKSAASRTTTDDGVTRVEEFCARSLRDLEVARGEVLAQLKLVNDVAKTLTDISQAGAQL